MVDRIEELAAYIELPGPDQIRPVFPDGGARGDEQGEDNSVNDSGDRWNPHENVSDAMFHGDGVRSSV